MDFDPNKISEEECEDQIVDFGVTTMIIKIYDEIKSSVVLHSIGMQAVREGCLFFCANFSISTSNLPSRLSLLSTCIVSESVLNYETNLDTVQQINYNKCCHTVSGFWWYLIIKGEVDNAGKQVI